MTLVVSGTKRSELQMMPRFMTWLTIKTDKYALHVFRAYRQIIISEEIQLIKIYKVKPMHENFLLGLPTPVI